MQEAIIGQFKEQIHTYGLDFIKFIAETLRPYLPVFIPDKQLISFAVAMIALLFPVAIGTTITAAEIMAKVAIFGVKTTVNTAEIVAKASISSASLLTNLLIRKPIYLLTYPLRRYSQNKEIMRRLEFSQIKEEERFALIKNCESALRQPQKLFVIIRQINGIHRTTQKDIKVLLGSLQKNDKVERLLRIVRKNGQIDEKESIQFICNGVMIKMDQKLVNLPKNQFGAVQIYYTSLQTFG